MQASLTWVVSLIVFGNLIGIMFAGLLFNVGNGKVRLFFTTLFIYPMAISMAASGVIWTWLFNTNDGINTILRPLGLPAYTWLDKPSSALPSLILVSIWVFSGLAMIFYLASFQNVNKETIESARIDGASFLRILTRILLPEAKNAFIVSGASRGIGKAVSRKLAGDGYAVVITDIADTSAVRETISRNGGSVLCVEGDITKADTIDRVVDAVDSTGLRLKGLVNNAFNMVRGTFLELSREDWLYTFDVSFFSAVTLCRRLIPAMIKNGGGSVVNISSVHALAAGDTDSVAYDAAKAAMNALTRSLAAEFGKSGVRVNSVLPGLVLSERIIEWQKEKPDEFNASLLSHALGRAGRPEEIAEVISFLISDNASFITGSAMLVDGGQMAAINETTALKIMRDHKS